MYLGKNDLEQLTIDIKYNLAKLLYLFLKKKIFSDPPVKPARAKKYTSYQSNVEISR